MLEFLHNDNRWDLQTCLYLTKLERQCFNNPTSAPRVSELHTLSRSPTCLRWNQDGSVTLLTFLPFVAKSKRASAGWRAVTPLTDDAELCPVTYLSRFLHLTVDTGSGWPSQPWRAGTTNTTPHLIATSLKSGISLVYQTAGVMNAHSEYVGSHAYKFWVFLGFPFLKRERG